MRVSTADARDIIPELVRKAEAGEVIHLTRYGRDVAVLVNQETYDRYMRVLMTDN